MRGEELPWQDGGTCVKRGELAQEVGAPGERNERRRLVRQTALPAVLKWLKTGKIDTTWSGGTLKGKAIYSLFGSFGDGLFAKNPVGKADLEANLAGLSFWEGLDKGGNKFKFDICTYVTAKWDENKNPNVASQKKPPP